MADLVAAHAFGMGSYFDETAVEITSGDLKTYEYRSDETNRWVKMEFCPTCATNVTYTALTWPGSDLQTPRLQTVAENGRGSSSARKFARS
jgi:hypothetical protein